jgi:hypothetical protein
MKSIYVIGSLRNPNIMKLSIRLRELGLDVFDDWHAASPDCDDFWKAYEVERGNTYGQALKGHMAQHIFEFDKFHLDRTDGAVLLMPAGKSGHLELGYTLGKGKPGFYLFDGEPAADMRWDVMTQFATEIFFDIEKFLATMKEKYVG